MKFFIIALLFDYNWGMPCPPLIQIETYTPRKPYINNGQSNLYIYLVYGIIYYKVIPCPHLVMVPKIKAQQFAMFTYIWMCTWVNKPTIQNIKNLFKFFKKNLKNNK